MLALCVQPRVFERSLDSHAAAARACLTTLCSGRIAFVALSGSFGVLGNCHVGELRIMQLELAGIVFVRL